MPSTQRKNQTTHSQARQPSLFDGDRKSYVPATTPVASATSATHAQDNDYLCHWLRSRLEDGLWLICQESALTATQQQRQQVTRLAHKARALGLAVWPPRRHVREVA